VARTRTDARGADYGPSLPELLGPRLRALGQRSRLALLLALAALLVLAAAVVTSRQGAVKSYRQSETDARQRGLAAIPFQFDYSSKLRLSRPPAAYVRAERRIGGTLASRFEVSELRLGRQRGLISGFMPIVATRYERRAARRFEGFRLQFEGRSRVNDVEGYQFAFTARLTRRGAPPRQLFGRVVMLPEPFDPSEPKDEYPPGQKPTRGLLITMLATSLDKVPSATRVGDEGLLQRPFRSFRFGS
jgi:hypothetical protein